MSLIIRNKMCPRARQVVCHELKPDIDNRQLMLIWVYRAFSVITILTFRDTARALYYVSTLVFATLHVLATSSSANSDQ